nr:diaminopimelate epimerase [Oceanococcus sp. HetDA_MAG_MS8]
MNLPFVKMQALGNDFVVLDGHHPLPPLEPALLRRLADRRLGVGCDQILVVDPPPSAEVDFGYRIFNADGSAVGQCGNGARCLARYVVQRGLTQASHIRIQTASTTMQAELSDDDLVSVQMAVPDFSPQSLPLRRPLAVSYDFAGQKFWAVSMGNPHLVTQVADVDKAPLEQWGPEWSGPSADLPEGANVGVVQVLAPDQVRLRVFERGAGETPACGSGACAAVACLVQHGVLEADQPVTVALRGGSLVIRWAGGDRPLWMTGPAHWVFEGSWRT